MNDTVTKLMALADEWANHCRGWLPIDPKYRQALHDELVRLFTPLSDEQIKQATGAGGEYWATSKIYIKAIFQAAEKAHGITGESK